MKVLVIRKSDEDIHDRFGEIIKREEEKQNPLIWVGWNNLAIKFNNGDEYQGYIIRGNSYYGIMACARDYDDVDSNLITGEISSICDYYLHIRPLAHGKNQEKFKAHFRRNCEVYKKG